MLFVARVHASSRSSPRLAQATIEACAIVHRIAALLDRRLRHGLAALAADTERLPAHAELLEAALHALGVQRPRARLAALEAFLVATDPGALAHLAAALSTPQSHVAHRIEDQLEALPGSELPLATDPACPLGGIHHRILAVLLAKGVGGSRRTHADPSRLAALEPAGIVGTGRARAPHPHEQPRQGSPCEEGSS
jgi:hypothetical protein